MTALTPGDLYSLENYARVRDEFRARVIAHKKRRRVALGPHAALYFEDALTMQYQVQEMLRLERIFEADKIQEELEVYNPLIPDGSNWKATFMIEYEDAEERKQALARLVGIESTVWMRVGEFDKVFAVADEDLDRATEHKTASVHFLRFELSPAMVEAVKRGAHVAAGADHPAYRQETQLAPEVRDALRADLH